MASPWKLFSVWAKRRENKHKKNINVMAAVGATEGRSRGATLERETGRRASLQRENIS